MFSSISKAFILALAVTSCDGAGIRNLQSCSETCSTQGSCSSGQINVCHEAKENECIDAAEWNEHCTDFGDTCGACSTSSGSSGCFSSTSTLLVQGKGPVSMEEARVGDMVLASAGSYEPLYAFGHLKADVNAEFLKIKTTVDTLEITAEHLLNVVGKEHPVRADSVNAGDSLVSLEGTARVLKITTTTSKGLYAPLTPSGKVVVNNIAASSYIALTEDSSDSIELGSFSMSHSDFLHLTLTPFRLFCMGVSNKPCQIYNEAGLPAFAAWGIDTVQASHNGNFWGNLKMVVCMPIAAVLLAAEWVFGPSLAVLALFSLAVGASFWKKSAGKKAKTL